MNVGVDMNALQHYKSYDCFLRSPCFTKANTAKKAYGRSTIAPSGPLTSDVAHPKKPAKEKVPKTAYIEKETTANKSNQYQGLHGQAIH
eukprot:3181844-Amphidinium_carterae.1